MALNDYRAVYMPYCLRKQGDGRYAVLNREYKPVGFKTSDWINYDEYPVCVNIKDIGPATAKKLSCHSSEDTDDIFLYHDGCNPLIDEDSMAGYLDKLKLLAKMKVE